MTKKLKTFVNKMAPAFISFLAIILTFNANSSSGCYVLYQPKIPAKLDDFKKIK